jgi:hypothetical protein
MISAKSSTNPESFIKTGRGRRIDLAISGGFTPVHYEKAQISLHLMAY